MQQAQLLGSSCVSESAPKCIRISMAHLMRLCHELGHACPHIVGDIRHVGQEPLCHAEQCLMRPAMEPIQLGAVDKGRELTGPDAELVTHRAEAQHNVQVAPDLQHTAE